MIREADEVRRVEGWPDPALVALADSLKCSPDPPWSDKVVYWLPSGDVYNIESIAPGYPRFWCDVSRPEWKVILQEWKDQKRRYIYLCEVHASVYILR